jgi:serine/threonine protein kinase
MSDEGYFRRFRNPEERASHTQYLPILSEAGLAPRIIKFTNEGVLLETCTPLEVWIAERQAFDVATMRLRCIRLTQQIHSLGICHRDLHARNVVVDAEDHPLVIDLDLACSSNPAQRCYDMIGPESGIAIANQHLALGGPYAEYGVWWNSPVDGLWRIFGTL